MQSNRALGRASCFMNNLPTITKNGKLTLTTANSNSPETLRQEEKKNQVFHVSDTGDEEREKRDGRYGCKGKEKQDDVKDGLQKQIL